MIQLNPDAIRNLPAGPELDRLVAEHVLGWRYANVRSRHNHDIYCRDFVSPRGFEAIGTDGSAWEFMDFPPEGAVVMERGRVCELSTTWSGLGMVVEAMEKRGKYLRLKEERAGASSISGKMWWIASFHAEPVYADTAPLAVARAALLSILAESAPAKAGVA